MYLEHCSAKSFFFFVIWRKFRIFALFTLLFGWYWKGFLGFILMER
ncbi:putative membrane protein [Helicobacter pylori Hp P-15b]|uniref:Putative membrane protein n=1 Tax=Helicobacter pylori Hp P-15 TaxID=992080 RepID=J0QDS8_HELPX|nr:putative membrane protein [Helicobacter pylori Hp P-15]EJC34133.1 putative membrane protein [Helicobacter pylori Hp P-15b]